VKTLEITNKSISGHVIGIMVRHLEQGTYLLHLEIRDPRQPNQHMTLYFAIPDSRIVAQNGIGFLASPGNSYQILSAVARVMKTRNTDIVAR